ncbi:hypothetical protein Airi02_050730 [Actinoallomurus iriomotensis]|uniref:Uncharacterized protein n=1 Tax=Actinoallomurus iriomotensis TaxID=478107 RepID=A0A9W6W184_9ACTN|nr:hypothetical protein Airi02_050730 [Actinoallomurus iriomotensis]
MTLSQACCHRALQQIKVSEVVRPQEVTAKPAWGHKGNPKSGSTAVATPNIEDDWNSSLASAQPEQRNRLSGGRGSGCGWPRECRAPE